MGTIRKAVFPVAGLGTRFLPATKANPKEMLTVVDKPLIQYAVEEALAQYDDCGTLLFPHGGGIQLEALQRAGVDMNDPQVIRAVMDSFRKIVGEMEEILAKE